MGQIDILKYLQHIFSLSKADIISYFLGTGHPEAHAACSEPDTGGCREIKILK